MDTEVKPDYDVWEIPDFATHGGISFPAKIAYKTYGELNAARDNVIVMPTYYGGRHPENAHFVGAGRAIDPAKHFIVIPNMFCNGLSSSPSNTDGALGRGAFPDFTFYDNIEAQYRLLTEHFDVQHVALAVGFSMGAAQAYQWGASYPEFVRAIAPICGTAKTSPHNFVMLDGLKATLKLDPAFKGGWYESQPVQGILAFGRVYAGWLWSQTYFRDRLYLQMGLKSTEDVIRFTQNYFLQNDANNLLAMLRTWQLGDISANEKFGGDIKQALNAITCRAIVMPCDTDLYFRVPDNEQEVQHMPNAEVRTIRSDFGHGAGFLASPADAAFIDNAIIELLS